MPFYKKKNTVIWTKNNNFVLQKSLKRAKNSFEVACSLDDVRAGTESGPHGLFTFSAHGAQGNLSDQ